MSVVVPVRNPRREWLDAAIDSAFLEDGCRIEVVLVDDGSDLPPRAWLSDRNLDRVRIHRIEHRGPGAARNRALEILEGDYVRFLDADDTFVPGSTSRLLDAGRGDPSLVTFGATVYCGPDLEPHRVERCRRSGRVHLDVARGRFAVTLPAILFPRGVVRAAGPFDEELKVQGDWDFVLRVTEVADVKGLGEPVYHYRRYPSSHSSVSDARRSATHSTVAIVRGYLARHPEIKGTRAERQVRAYAQFLIARLREPERPMRSPRFRKAARADPLRGGVILIRRSGARALRRIKAMLGGSSGAEEEAAS